MDAVTIESDDKQGAAIYEKIIFDVLSELHARFIERLYLKINIKEGYFILSAIINENTKPLKISDLSLEPVKEGTSVTIDPIKERFLPSTLNVLTSFLGKEKIIQPSRYRIIIKDTKPSEIEDLIIFDYTDYAQTVITEMLFWIAPEQFKITRVLKDTNRLTILFSEYNLKDLWFKEMEKIHES